MTAVSTHSFYVEQVREVTVLSFTVSSLTGQNYEFVSDELFEIVEYLTSTYPIRVVLDLSNVREIDDWGLAMLRAFHETIQANNGTAIFCRLSQDITDFLNDTKFANGFPIHDTRGEALRAFNN